MITSRPSTAQSVTVVSIDRATTVARAHADPGPAAIWVAAASAARSAAACARWRAITADPTWLSAPVTAMSAATAATAVRLAAPLSSDAGFGRCHRLCGDGEAQQDRRSAADPRDDQFTVPPEIDRCALRGDPAGHLGRRAAVTARRQACRLTRGVDAPHLRPDGRQAGDTHAEHHHHRRDRERRLDRGATEIITQTLVLSARLMMLVSAPTIESPVTTV